MLTSRSLLAAGALVASFAALPALALDAPHALLPATSGTSRSIGVDGALGAMTGHDLGRVAPDARVHAVVVLALREGAALDRLIDAQTNPASPQYHHFLSEAAFDRRFDPDGATVARVSTALHASGFTVHADRADRLVLEVDAPAAAAARLFAAEIHAYRDARGYTWLAPASRILLPVPLRNAVAGVAFDRPLVFPQSGVEAVPQPSPSPSASPTPSPKPHFFGHGGYGAPAYRAAYDFPSGPNVDGTGVRVAEIMDGNILNDDLNAYARAFGLKRTGPPPVIIAVGHCDYLNPNLCRDNITSSTDAEAIVGAAPGASVFEYFPPGITDAGVILAVRRLVQQNLIDVVNVPFGGCETALQQDVDAYAPLLGKGSAMGMTFVAAAFGGAYSCGVNEPETVPAFGDNPNALAVGLTDLTIDPQTGAYVAESADKNTSGGVSVLFGLPPFQQGIAGITSGGRNVPDLAFATSVNGEGFAYRFYTAWGVDNGTTASVAGLLADIVQHAGRLGAVNRTLYRAYAQYGYGAVGGGPALFRDVQSGCDGFPGLPSPCATPGYDVLTGIGTVDGSALARLLHS